MFGGDKRDGRMDCPIVSPADFSASYRWPSAVFSRKHFENVFRPVCPNISAGRETRREWHSTPLAAHAHTHTRRAAGRSAEPGGHFDEAKFAGIVRVFRKSRPQCASRT